MKKIFNRIMMMAVVMISTLLIVVPMETQAAKRPSFGKKHYVLFYANPKGSAYINSLKMKNISKKAVISDIKCSNAKILGDIRCSLDSKAIFCKTMKRGTCTISCTVRQRSKKYNIECKVTVKKANPFKYVKINGKNVYKDGKNNLCSYHTSRKSAVIEFELNEGWEVKRLFSNDHMYMGATSKDKEFKNGDRVKIRKSYTTVKLDVANSKGEVYRYLILLHGKGAKNSPYKN